MITGHVRSVIASALLCLLAVAAFVALGRWQWHSAFAHQQRPTGVVTAAPVPLDSLSKPRQWLPRSAIGAFAVAEGDILSDGAFATSARPTTRGQRPWQVLPLRLADGSVLAVALAVAAEQVPSGAFTAVGRLHPSEDSPARGAWQPAQAELATATLVDRWPYPVVRDGYLVVTRAGAGEPIPIARFTSAPSGSIGWRNIAYALQWWAFALFAAFVWWRHVTDRESDVAAV